MVNLPEFKPGGKLSLNKINNEAGLGHSYIHKFTEFVENEATPKIKSYNKTLDSKDSIESPIQGGLTDVEKLKSELKRERALKERYRKERDDSRVALVEVEQLNSTLMFRVHELQEVTPCIKPLNINN